MPWSPGSPHPFRDRPMRLQHQPQEGCTSGRILTLLPCAFSGSKPSSQASWLFFFLAATRDISLCILTGGLCVCTRGERQVYICFRAPPPSPNVGGFWREVGLLKSFCLSEFCPNAFSSAVHVFLLHLEKKAKVAEGGEGTRSE